LKEIGLFFMNLTKGRKYLLFLPEFTPICFKYISSLLIFSSFLIPHFEEEPHTKAQRKKEIFTTENTEEEENI
jgi:hypothetical protein